MISLAPDPRRAIAAACRRLEKFADEGDGQDGSFEQSMSDVVHLVLKDKVPELLDYEMGFQLVDRDSDDNKAVGVTVFKVGPHFLFQPSFFINGRLKGTELLYIKDLDLFVPLSDGWVQHLIDKHPQPLGRRVGRDLARQGASSPDLRQITRPPMKWASFEAEVLPRWAAAVTSDPLEKLAYGLPEFVKEAGPAGVELLARFVDHCPRVAYDLEKFHGDRLLAACKEAAARPAAARPAPAGSFADWLDAAAPPAKSATLVGEVRETTFDPAEEDPTLFAPNPERPRPRAGGFDVADERPEDRVSTAFTAQATQRLANPTETGLYEVLVRPLDYEKCLVVVGPKTAHGSLIPCLLVRLRDRKFVLTDAARIWCGKAYGRQDYYDWWGSLPEATSLDEERPDPDPTPGGFDSKAYRKKQVLLARNGEATAPFRAEFDLGDADGGTTYQVRFETCRSSGIGVGHGVSMSSSGAYDDMAWRKSDGCIAVGTRRGGRLVSVGGTLYAPADTRVLDVESPGYGDREGLITLGDPVDIHLDLVSKTLPLSVQLEKGAYWVNRGKVGGEDATLRHLVLDHGLRLPAARALLKEAAAIAHARDPVFACRVKYADPYMTRDVSAPAIPDPATTTEHTLTQSLPGQPLQYRLLPVPSMRPRDDVDQVYNLRNLPPQPWMREAVEEAADTGSREVFDTSMIGAMLSTTQGDLQVDRYFGPLMKGQDAIGRVLMSFYWHGKDFEERYGKEDLVPLEDSLRNTFINMGKLILNLKQNAVEDPLDADRELDLENASDQ